MTHKTHRGAFLGTALTALALAAGSLAAAAPAAAQPVASRPAETLNLSIGSGTLVNLSSPMSDLFVANEAVADVQVRSATQLYIFGKKRGVTTIYATDRSGRVVYGANVNVAENIGSVEEMLRIAMPEANIRATPMNNLVLLTGTVSSLEDVNEATRLAMAYVGEGVHVVNRVRSAVPLQVNLRVKIAEVNRSLTKQFGINLLANDSTGGSTFGVSSGQLIDPNTGSIAVPNIGSVLRIGTRVLGLDLIGALNMAEADGLVTTLAEPNLTALSGETASFLAGGEFPIPVAQSRDTISIEYKQYGVGLAFTPIVLADGRISMRVRPEVSELSNEGSIQLNGFSVPALTTRRAETTVELGSGQSFMLAGLLRNSNANDIDRTPFLGDLPILGTLFRSTRFRRSETELVIIVTPYLVRPVSGRMALPTDGYRAPTDPERVFEGQSFKGVSGPRPVGQAVAPAVNVSSSVSAATAAPGFKL